MTDLHADTIPVAEALEALAADERDRAAKWHMSVAAKLLRAYWKSSSYVPREAVIEECAQVCFEIVKRKRDAAERMDDKEKFESADNARARANGAQECGSALRELKSRTCEGEIGK